MTETIWQFFMGIGNVWYSVFMGLIAFVETLFPPFPGDVLYIAISGLGVSRNIPVLVLWLPGFLGCVVSTFILDSMGRSSKLEKLESLIIRTSGKHGFERSKRLLARHGVWMLILSRFVPGVRSLLVVAAASSGMKKSSVLAYASLSAAFWYVLMVLAGVVLGAELNLAADFMAKLTTVLLMATLTAVVIGGVVIIFRMKKRDEE
ncbi:MAG: VTT domain-containing protein [Candidatus Sabulitectum sp.]|nr:VTT domain-containing protein [Candidatus Sabulitectum sp.]